MVCLRRPIASPPPTPHPPRQVCCLASVTHATAHPRARCLWTPRLLLRTTRGTGQQPETPETQTNTSPMMSRAENSRATSRRLLLFSLFVVFHSSEDHKNASGSFARRHALVCVCVCLVFVPRLIDRFFGEGVGKERRVSLNAGALRDGEDDGCVVARRRCVRVWPGGGGGGTLKDLYQPPLSLHTWYLQRQVDGLFSPAQACVRGGSVTRALHA